MSCSRTELSGGTSCLCMPVCPCDCCCGDDFGSYGKAELDISLRYVFPQYVKLSKEVVDEWVLDSVKDQKVSVAKQKNEHRRPKRTSSDTSCDVSCARVYLCVSVYARGPCARVCLQWF